MCGWAIVSGFTAMADSYTHLLVLRLLLGWFEAPFYPGAIYLLSRFYTKHEASGKSLYPSGKLFDIFRLLHA